MTVSNTLFAVYETNPNALLQAFWGVWLQRGLQIDFVKFIANKTDVAEVFKLLDCKKGKVWKLYSDNKLSKKGIQYPSITKDSVFVPGSLSKSDSENPISLTSQEVYKQISKCVGSKSRLITSVIGASKSTLMNLSVSMSQCARETDLMVDMIYKGIDSIKGPDIYPDGRKTRLMEICDYPFPRFSNLDFKSSGVELLSEPDLVVNMGKKREYCLVGGKPLVAEPRQLMWLGLMASRKTSGMHCPQKTKCVSCDLMPCALGGKVYHLTEKDKEFIEKSARTFGAYENNELKGDPSERLFWSSAASRVRQKLKNQYPESYSYLDSLRGMRVAGCRESQHMFNLDRDKIKVNW